MRFSLSVCLGLIFLSASAFANTGATPWEERVKWIVFNCDDANVAKLRITEELKTKLASSTLSCETSISPIFNEFKLRRNVAQPAHMSYEVVVGLIYVTSHDNYNAADLYLT